MRSETLRPIAPTPPREADITVLAAARGALRPEIRLLTVEHWMARQPAVVGEEVALTARLLDQLPFTPTAVVVVAPKAPLQSSMKALLPALKATLSQPDKTAVTITYPGPTAPDLTNEPTPHNHPTTTLQEALAEAVTTARQHSLTTTSGNCVLLVQHPIPARTTVLQASPHRTTPVHVEDHGPNPRTPQSSLTRDTARQLATMAKNAAITAGTNLTLHTTQGPHGPVVLRCHPTP